MKIILAFVLALITPVASAQWLLSGPSSDSVTLYGEVSDESAARLIAQIQEDNKTETAAPIYLYINSPGGSVLAGGMIVDAMAASRRPIYTVDVGLAASMAAYIHSYGAKRYMTPHAILMFHRASISIHDDLSHITQQIALINRLCAMYEEHTASLTGLPVAEIRAREDAEWWMLAADAAKFHLIDGETNPASYPTH